MSGLKRRAIDPVQEKNSQPVKRQKLTKKPALSQVLVIESDSEEEEAEEEEEERGGKEGEKAQDEETEDVRSGNGISNSKGIPSKKPTPSDPTPKPSSILSGSYVPKSKSNSPLKKQRYESTSVSSTNSEESEDEGNSNQSDSRSSEEQSSNSAAAVSSESSESGSESDSVVIRDEDGRAQEPIRSSPVINKQPSEFVPPPGFEAADITSPSSTLEDLISNSNLNGKELWHVIVPAEVPIKSIKKVSLQNVANGHSVLEHDGVHFGLQSEGTDQGSCLLLLPSATHNQYRSTSVGVVKTLRLQQLVDLPLKSHRQDVSIDGIIAPSKVYKKSVRQQPQGLKMRYRPFGDESSSESSHRRPEFRTPIIPELAGSSPDRNRAIFSDDQFPKKHPSSKKKRRKQDAEPPFNASNSTLTQRSPSNSPFSIHGAILPMASEPGDNTLDAKAARRAEKRKRRKEARVSGSLEPSKASEIRRKMKELEKASEPPPLLEMPSTNISDHAIQSVSTNINSGQILGDSIVGSSDEKVAVAADSNKKQKKGKRRKTEETD